MSELLENLSSIKYLPIFPLPIVLLPNELLPLHIFEPRYRKMLNDIQLDNNFFGLSYFDAENSEGSIPDVGSYGCLAEVREVQTMEDGRSNILSSGVMRYQLKGYIESSEPYLVGEISIFEDYEEDSSTLQPLADDVYSLFTRVANAAHELGGSQGRLPEIPQAEPQSLSFLVAAAFSLHLDMKYDLMKMRSTVDRLRKLKIILKEAVIKVEESAKINKIAKTNGHANKNIDLN